MSASSATLKRNALLIAILIPVSLVIVALSNALGAIVSVAVIGIIFFISFFFISWKYPRYNIVILLSANFILPVLIKALGLFDVPFGVANEGFCAIMFLTLILNKRISGIRTLPGILLTCWFLYQCVELANPYANSRVAAFYSIRAIIPFISCFFVMYSSVETKRDVYIFMIGWMTLGLLAALYCLWQEFAGLPPWDYAYATSSENNYFLLFTWGRWRKFSFFFNPSEFGMLMSLTGLAAFTLFFFTKQMKLKVYSGIVAFFTMWSMLYSGSRTAMFILPVGFFIFTAITLHPRALMMVGIIGLLGAVMILRPAGSAMYVMSTAFTGAEDPSMQVRVKNRAMIRSYILKNPVGYGLGGTGYLGKHYSAGTLIGMFDTDSEYVRIAVEMGWLGLLFWCTILTVIFGYGANLYFKIPDPEWKTILVVALTFMFMLIVAQYAQEIFVSFLIPMLMACMFGIMARVHTKFFVPALKDVEE